MISFSSCFFSSLIFPSFNISIFSESLLITTFIREKLINHGFESLTGKDGKWIQARTKGPGHGSISRAFYAKTTLVKKIFETAS